MKIYKFGGASVKDANGVKNILKILTELGHKDLLLVISAMGKMTNAFEGIVDSYFNKKEELKDRIELVTNFHNAILSDLFSDPNHFVYEEINLYFDYINDFVKRNKSDRLQLCLRSDR